MQITIFAEILAGAAWVTVVIFLTLIIIRRRQERDWRKLGLGILLALVFALMTVTISAGLVFIQPQERGVVISAVTPLGYREQVLGPGLHWVVPYAETVERYSVAKNTYTMAQNDSENMDWSGDAVAARTADGQVIFVETSIIYSINPEEVLELHILWQHRIINELVRATVRGGIRDTVSKFRVEEVYSDRRSEMTEMIHNSVEEIFSRNGLILSEFILRDITFSEEYAAAVERKQIAEQQAQQAAYTVEQRKQEAEQLREIARGNKDAAILEAEGRAEARIIEASAEANALQMIKDALQQNTDLLNYRYIEKLAPGTEVILIPGR